jgi:hypothetical protein
VTLRQSSTFRQSMKIHIGCNFYLFFADTHLISSSQLVLPLLLGCTHLIDQ